MELLEIPEQASPSTPTTKKPTPKKGKAKQAKKKGRTEPSDESDSDSSVSPFEMTDSEEDKKATKANTGLGSGDSAGCEEEGHKDTDEDSEEALAKDDEAYLLELFPDI